MKMIILEKRNNLDINNKIKLFMTAFKSKFLTVLHTTFNTFSIKNPNT